MTNPKKAHAGQGNAPAPPPLPCKRRLASAQDLKTFLADIMNRVHRGELDVSVARCLGYLSQVMHSVIATNDIEARLHALEEQQNDKAHR